MRRTLIDAMGERGGVISRVCALQIVSRHIVDKALRTGALVRVFPNVYALAELVDDPATMDRAAATYVPNGAFSHTTALRLHGIAHQPLDGRRHLATPPQAEVRRNDHLVVHRRRGFIGEPPHVVVRSGLVVVRVERSVIESWSLLVRGEQRSPAITAVNSGLTTGARLLDALDSSHRPAGSAEMRSLFTKLALGCRSELEIWGHASVFDDPRLRPVVSQHAVNTAAGLFILDRAHLDERVGVELDGAAWHGSSTQRERDVRRDAALAAAGWQIVRFAHARLRAHPSGCRDELLEILAVRRRRQPA